MPVVIIEMWEGRTEKEKERLIKGVTRAFEEIGVKAEWLNIIIHDVPKSNWGTSGEQASKTAEITPSYMIRKPDGSIAREKE